LRKDRLRKVTLEQIAMRMLEEGKPLTAHEYKSLGSAPIRYSTAIRIFGRWERVLSYIESSLPKVWEELTNPPKPVEPKVEVTTKPAMAKVIKPKPGVRKVVQPKVSVKKEIEDE
jgi:hypothetical protein